MLPERTLQLQVSQVIPRGEDLNASVREEATKSRGLPGAMPVVPDRVGADGRWVLGKH